MNNRSLKQSKTFLLVLVSALLISQGIAVKAIASVVADSGIWETWTSESYTMTPRESFQLRTSYDEIPARRWLLVVDGGDNKCDLSVLRVNGEELLYYKIDESRHEVSIPWGEGEELIMVLTNRNNKGGFVVSFLGPPKEQNFASYSYSVNRALEAYAAGQRLDAQALCRDALIKNPDDGVAKVLLAGFMRESHRYDEAFAMINDANKERLPAEMRTLALELEKELELLRAPLPKSIRDDLAKAESALTNNEFQTALDFCEKLLGDDKKLSSASRAKVKVLRGRALEGLGRNFEAIDSYTQALSYDQSKSAQAVAYYYMAELYLKMENMIQAEGAFTIAIKFGLPTGLGVQARESLRMVSDRLNKDR